MYIRRFVGACVCFTICSIKLTISVKQQSCSDWLKEGEEKIETCIDQSAIIIIIPLVLASSQTIFLPFVSIYGSSVQCIQFNLIIFGD